MSVIIILPPVPTFADICSCFRRAGRPIADLGSAGHGGCIAVIAEGARVAALSFAPDEESVLFTKSASRRSTRTRGWAFGGPPRQVRPLTRQLLGVEPEHIFAGGKQ